MQSLRWLNFRSLRFFRSSPPASERTPWFLDPSPQLRVPAPEIAAAIPVVPENAPDVLKDLHSQMRLSPHLDLSQLVVSPAILPSPGPPLPERKPHGRRMRGGTYAGESIYDIKGTGLWSWVIMAQVKAGTENRGGIESVVRLVRKALLKREPPVPLAPKSRRPNGSEWVMIDAGTFAVHIVSKGAREKYLSDTDGW